MFSERHFDTASVGSVLLHQRLVSQNERGWTPAESIGLDESCLTECKLTLKLWAFMKKTIVLKIEADRTPTVIFVWGFFLM